MAINVLITGGAGFIGSDMVRHHLEKGDNVWVVDNLSAGLAMNLTPYMNNEAFSFDEGDLRTWPKLGEAIAWSDRIYHLAAVVGQHQVLGNPIETITNHINVCERILEEMSRVNRDTRLLITSTSSVYYYTPPDEDGMLREDTVLQYKSGDVLQHTYPLSKLMCEYLALAYVMEKDLFCTIARPFNTIGVNQRSAYGMVVPSFVQEAIKNEPITVFGDGKQYRAFTNVHDTVRAFDLLLSNPESKGQIVNVGSDQKSTIINLAHMVKERAQSDSEIIFVPYQEAYGMDFRDVEQRCPCTDLLFSLTGFKTEWSLQATVDEVIEYQKNKLNNQIKSR